MCFYKLPLLYLLFSFIVRAESRAETIPFQYYERLIFIKVSVNSTDSLCFLFDTGANASAIDKTVAGRLKLETIKTGTIEGSAGTITVPSVRSAISVGNLIVNNLALTSYDLSGSLSPPGQRLDGILGTDFLKHFVVSIDFGKLEMTLSKSATDTVSGFAMSFELYNEIPQVGGKVNDIVETAFRYDSGASLFDTENIYFNVTTAILEALLKTDTALKPVAFLSASGVGGDIKLPVYKVHSVKFSAITIDKPFLIVQPEQGYFARTDAVGFFGNNLAEKFEKITLDFTTKRMYLGKAKR